LKKTSIQWMLWRILYPIFKRLHIDIIKPFPEAQYIQVKPGFEYWEVKPGFHYVPDYYGCSWEKRVDLKTLPEFGDLAKQVVDSKKSSLYYDRLYVIYQCLRSIQKSHNPEKPVHIAEIGVQRGGTSFFMASVIKTIGIHDATIHGFDTFEGYQNEDYTHTVEKTRTLGPDMESEYESVKAYLSAYPNIELYKGRIQDTSHEVDHLVFSFVHIDVNLYVPTLFSLNFFDLHLEKGGIMIIDDFGGISCPGVMQAIDTFLSEKKDYCALNPLTEQYILFKSGD